MSEITELIPFLQSLLPGLLCAWIFHGLTAYPKPAAFERIIQALVFTVIIQALVALTEKSLISLGKLIESPTPWGGNDTLITSAIYAIIIGILLSYLTNNDIIHSKLRAMGITRESSYSSEWYGAFLKPSYVVLHLKDERRIYGWPSAWPSQPNTGHYVIKEPSWLDGLNELPITGADSILIDAQDVAHVEFMSAA